MLLSVLTLVPLALSTVSAVAESPNRAVHQSIAKRARNDTDISKRAYTGSRWSFYDVGLGACGKTNVNSDFIVALNQQQFGNSYPSPFCGKTITMNYQGKTATATIMDSCPGCPYGALDLSRGLFKHFASEDTGIIYGEWSIAGEKAAAAPTTTSPKPKPTPTTTKWTPPVTTEQARITTSKKPAPAPTSTKAAPTTTWSPPTHDAPTTSAPHASPSLSSSHKAAKAQGSSAWSSSYVAASASSASLASSYASILPSASGAANSTGNGTIAEIQHNLDALGAILARLSTLIVKAIPDDKE
ncbi:hypothetical protein D9619_005988 [Psilocybe cf. subviscida]|uniref:RlpA-like protein double-psi beta-barrel domain-containing protein n=1 Tax=Psilocybe cf. subviscida TaxID=2480587 RepID=A0A8H5FBH2_9AGAR|nr:hypothetical protein D9619_005988 [Psilocybe cf. subviscida]